MCARVGRRRSPAATQVKEVLEKEGQRPTYHYAGCVTNDGSPAAMLNHVRQKHPEDAPSAWLAGAGSEGTGEGCLITENDKGIFICASCKPEDLPATFSRGRSKGEDLDGTGAEMGVEAPPADPQKTREWAGHLIVKLFYRSFSILVSTWHRCETSRLAIEMGCNTLRLWMQC